MVIWQISTEMILFNNDMDDVFNQLFRRMDNQNSERARYLVNGQSLTPDEFAQYRATVSPKIIKQ